MAETRFEATVSVGLSLVTIRFVQTVIMGKFLFVLIGIVHHLLLVLSNVFY